MIAESVLAIEMGAVARDILESIHPHPTLSETVMESAELALRRRDPPGPAEESGEVLPHPPGGTVTRVRPGELYPFLLDGVEPLLGGDIQRAFVQTCTAKMAMNLVRLRLMKM